MRHRDCHAMPQKIGCRRGQVAPFVLQAAALFGLVLLLAVSHVSAGAHDDEDCRELLVAGDRALGQDNFQEALGKYSEALIRAPENTRALFSRAQLTLRMKRYDSAKEDLDTLLRVAPQHIAGLDMRYKLSIQQGNLRQAASDASALAVVYRSRKNKTPEVAEMEKRSTQLKALAVQWEALHDVLEADPLALRVLPAQKEAQRQKNFGECVALVGRIIDEFTSSVDSTELRLRRVGCAVAIHQGATVTGDVKYVLQHNPHHLTAIVYNAMILRGMGAYSAAKKELQRCISVDPENNSCSKLFKLIRVEEKNMDKFKKFLEEKDYENAHKVLEALTKAEANPPYASQLTMWQCQVETGLRHVQQGLHACNNALESGNFNELDIRILMAELHLQNDDIPAAEAQVNVARDIQPNNEKVSEMMKKIANLRRNAGRKNYYKILGVSKTANAQEIRRAYRKLAKEKHPDKLRSKDMTEKEREKADEQFRSINEAKEVLLDEEKRAAYDRGEDPMNPNAQANNGNPFYGQEFRFTSTGGGFQGGFPGFPEGFPGFPGGAGGGGRGRTFFFHQQQRR